MNRWHGQIPAAASARQGEVFTLECHEWTGGQIKNTDDADDVRVRNHFPCEFVDIDEFALCRMST